MDKRLFLLLGETSRLPDGGDEEFIVLSTDIGEDCEEVDVGELDFVVSYLCAAHELGEAEAVARNAWSGPADAEISLTLLTDDQRKLARHARRIGKKVLREGPERLGGAIGYKRGSRQGREQAERILGLALMRKRWQIWK